jgi:hypothetical protein
VRRRGLWFSLGVALVVGGVIAASRAVPEARVMAAPRRIGIAERPSDGLGATVEDERPHTFRVPTGEPPTLTCDAARLVIAQVRKNLAYAPDPIAPRAFASATGDWLDPYGLWTVAPDAPLGAVIDKRASELVAEIEGRGADCAAAHEIGRALALWVAELRAIYEREVQPHLKDRDKGKFVAVDIETGAYEISTSELRACDALRARVPQAQIWLVLAGSDHARRFGAL